MAARAGHGRITQACPARVVPGDRALGVRTIVCDFRSTNGRINGRSLELPGRHALA